MTARSWISAVFTGSHPAIHGVTRRSNVHATLRRGANLLGASGEAMALAKERRIGSVFFMGARCSREVAVVDRVSGPGAVGAARDCQPLTLRGLATACRTMSRQGPVPPSPPRDNASRRSPGVGGVTRRCFWSLEKLSVRARPHEVDGAARLWRIINLIDQKEIPADMAFPVIRPSALQRVIPPFRTERGLVGDEVEHDCLEAMHVVSTRTREPLPVLEKSPREVHAPGRAGPLTDRRLSQAPQTSRPRWRTGPSPFSSFLPTRPWRCVSARSAP